MSISYATTRNFSKILVPFVVRDLQQQAFYLQRKQLKKSSIRHPPSISFLIRNTNVFEYRYHKYTKQSFISYTKLQRANLYSTSSVLKKQQPNTKSNMAVSNYVLDHRGAFNSVDYRLFFKDLNGKVISPWHDIPLFADKSKKIFNMIVEIPRWTNAKMEIATNEPMCPIKQDIKKGALRYVHNVFPHKGYIWNYGAFPQTWENPNYTDPSTQAKGDNDPIDVIEIGSRIAQRGDVITVKILGTIALIDEGETDWKIITIDTRDPLADQMNDIDDVEKMLPGLLRATIEWFKIYKIPEGKPQNKFAFNGEAKDREFAEKIVQEMHTFWKELMEKKTGEHKLDLKNVSLGNPHSLSDDQVKKILESRVSSDLVESVPIADQMAIDKWHFVKLI